MASVTKKRKSEDGAGDELSPRVHAIDEKTKASAKMDVHQLN